MTTQKEEHVSYLRLYEIAHSSLYEALIHGHSHIKGCKQCQETLEQIRNNIYKKKKCRSAFLDI